MKQRGFRYCKTRKRKLQQNGYNTTKKGKKIKWKCAGCNTNHQHKRTDLRRRYVLKRFVTYLIGTQSVREITVRPSAFRRHVAECWGVDPKPKRAGEVYDYIVIDVKHVATEACAIIRSANYVCHWQYGIRENSDLWTAALSVLPQPGAVVADGQKGICKALKHLWPDIVVQRCLVHVERNITTKLTTRPQTEAGKDLRWLVGYIWQIETTIDVSIFGAMFTHLHDIHRNFLTERTYNSHSEGKRKWWYTHGNVRSAYKQIHRLLEDDQLFAFIARPDLNLPKTTNGLEGGINSRIAELILRHRGMTKIHQKRVVDWYLDSRTEVPYFEREIT